MRPAIKYVLSAAIALSCRFVLAQGEKVQFSFATGYQQENFHWSIAGNSSGQHPNVYSELQWKQVRGPGVQLGIRWKVWKWVTLFGEVGRVVVLGGRVVDTDYGADNRQSAIYREQFYSDKGSTASWSLRAGGCFFKDRWWKLFGSAGYGVDYQHFYIVDHGGSFAGLNSRYVTVWKGPLVKLSAVRRLGAHWEAGAEAGYHQVSYGAKADWNLISSFAHPVSFRHMADGYGLDGGVNLGYRLSRVLWWKLGGGFFSWRTGRGGG